VVAGEEVFGEAQRRSGVLIDVGHSHTYIIPVFNNCPVKNAVRRLEVGGNLLTKCLMDGLSFSQIDLKKHYLLTNHIRESCMKVLPKEEARKIARRKEAWDAGIYQLPVYHEDTPGRYVPSPTDQDRYRKHLRVSAESVLLPELLFDPSM
jgi:actin-related protein 6